MSHQTLEQFGAVSSQTALEMARGVLKLAGANIGVGVTGIAGPGGGTEEKPVGLVYVAVCDDKGGQEVKELRLGRGGDERELVRYSSSS